jgi:FAD/FMN-containing dehydrogenase
VGDPRAHPAGPGRGRQEHQARHLGADLAHRRFRRATDALLARAWPGVQVVCFGHLGDGNLHYNIAPPAGTPHEAFLAYQGDVNRIVHDSVAAFGGSISAEHGIGALKRDELPRYKAQVELDLMRAIKAALDPLGIMNPGKIL